MNKLLNTVASSAGSGLNGATGGAAGAVTTVSPEGTDFDGVNDYLSRSSDLVGNVDSKTFTFSCWVYKPATNKTAWMMQQDSNNYGMYIYINTLNSIRIWAEDSTSTLAINAYSANGLFPIQTWCHLLISIDLSNSANRYVYLNNNLVTITWSTYSNVAIDFTRPSYYIGASALGSEKGLQRLSNLFLDYTYRDLSIEANRRLFITADGKPASGQASLNPILYLPMKDASTAHINEGTGGNFTPNGTLATSERGANQDNCVASYFDGVADYLSRGQLTTIATNKITISFSCCIDTSSSNEFISFRGSVDTNNYSVSIYVYANGRAQYILKSTSNVTLFSAQTPIIDSSSSGKANRVYSISIDLGVQNSTRFFLDGKNVAVTPTAFTDGLIDIKGSSSCIGARFDGVSYTKGSIGEVWLSNTYIDLSTNNPFWDATTNKPVPVRKVIANTGVTPLIAMPLDASNAGKNYGTGGDFTANSGPYVGARGASEFWARSMYGGSATLNANSLIKTVSLSSSTKISGCVAFKQTSANTYSGIFGVGTGSSNSDSISILSSGDTPRQIRVMFGAYGESGSLGPVGTGWNIVFFSRISSSSMYFVVYNQDSLVYSTTINYSPVLNLSTVFVGGKSNTVITNDWVGNIGFVYMHADYIDFSQEVNRNKFVDQLGFPTNLKEKIDAGIIPKPLIYLPFDDTSNLGKNLGTGGDFTVNGTVTAGADVLG